MTLVYHRVCFDCGMQKKFPSPSERCNRCAAKRRFADRRRPTFAACESCGIPKEGRAVYTRICQTCAQQQNAHAIRATQQWQVAKATGTETEREQQARECALRLAANIAPRINLGIRGEK